MHLYAHANFIILVHFFYQTAATTRVILNLFFVFLRKIESNARRQPNHALRKDV